MSKADLENEALRLANTAVGLDKSRDYLKALD